MGKSNFGGSLLSSHDSSTYREVSHKFGTLKVIPLAEIETHALMYEDDRKLGFSMLATHANGYSCKELLDRIVKTWVGECTADYALKQFDFILDCGGTGRSRTAIEWIVNQGEN